MLAGGFSELWENISDTVKHVADALSLTLVVGTVVKMLPAVAACLSIMWTLIRIYETKSVQRLLGHDRTSRTLRKLYQDAADEPVPDDMKKTLKDLK